MLEAKQKTRAGQEIRILDIPADSETHGCFQDLHGCENSKLFADKISNLCATAYGTARREFIRCLLSDQDRIIQCSDGHYGSIFYAGVYNKK